VRLALFRASITPGLFSTTVRNCCAFAVETFANLANASLVVGAGTEKPCTGSCTGLTALPFAFARRFGVAAPLSPPATLLSSAFRASR
jgi:hypothetical protein